MISNEDQDYDDFEDGFDDEAFNENMDENQTKNFDNIPAHRISKDGKKILKERPNKTQIKREIKLIQGLASAILEFSEEYITKLPLSETSKNALLENKKLTKGAYQRQLRYVVGLLRQEDIPAIQYEVDQHKLKQQNNTRQFHQYEHYRDQLLAGDKATFQELFEKYTNFDGQHVRQLVRNAQKEIKANKPPKSARLLFKYLKGLDD